MAHQINPDREYRLLQERLALDLNGAPASPVFTKILELLFSPEDAALARRLPITPLPLSKLSKRFSMSESELDKKLTELAHKGLVIDLTMGNERHFTLAPVVIGFFEFTFMRKGEELPWRELSQLFHEYMLVDDKFMRGVFAGKTQMERSLVHEEALPDELPPRVEICDWERASHIVKSAQKVAVSTCACRHKAHHLGHPCQHEMDNCLSFDLPAATLLKNGLAREISNEEGLEILMAAKEAGLCQNADNVQEGVGFICNCCRCCCGFVQAVRKFELRGAIVTSNWVATIDETVCVGCNKCVKACPVEALELSEKKARVLDFCLGCGVCHGVCPKNAIILRARKQRVYTPETMFDKLIGQAIERGKLADLLFSDKERWSHRALGRIAQIIEHAPPTRALLSIEPLQSIFLKTLVSLAKLGPQPTFE